MRTVEERARAALREPSPLQAVAFVWRGRWIVATCAALAAAAGVFVAEQRGTIWRAKSVIYVERQAPMLPGSDVAHWLGTRNYANTQAALLRSTPVLQAGLAAPGVEQSAMFGDSDNHLAWLRKRLTVVVGTDDDLITVQLESEAVDDACRVVNAIVNAYLARHSESQRKTASEVLGSLRRELERYEAELRTVQEEQVAFLEAHPGLVPGEGTDAGSVKLRELNLALTQAELGVMEVEAQLQAAKARMAVPQPMQRLPMPGVDEGSVKQLSDLQAQVDQLVQRRVLMLTTMTPDHPDVKRLDGAIVQLFGHANEVADRITQAHVGSLEQRLQGQRRLRDELVARIAGHERTLRDDDPAIAEYRGLEIRFDRARKIADALYERVRSIDINESLGENDQPPLSALVYERATPEGAVVAASKTSLAAIFGFVGVVLGLALAWARSIVWPKVHGPSDLGAELPVLGSLPKARLGSGSFVAALRRARHLEAAMQSLRAVLHFGARGRRHRTLQVVGVDRGAGASTVAAGLGIASAQAGQRTLVVDADFGAGSQAKLFGLDGGMGLRQVLARKVGADDAIAATEVPGLYVLPAGAPDTALQALDATVLPELLRELATRFDRVLVDSPALMAAVDARILAAVCDGSLLVLRPGSSSVAALQAAQDAVASVAGQVVGTVFRGVSRRAVHSARLHSAELLALHRDEPAPRGDHRVGEQA